MDDFSHYNPESGQILVFKGRGLVSSTIKFFTCSTISHVGIVTYVSRWNMRTAFDEQERLYKEGRVKRRVLTRQVVEEWVDGYRLFESTTMAESPCHVQRKLFSGVQVHFPLERIQEYKGEVWYCQLASPVRRLYEQEHGNRKLTQNLLDDVGHFYDGKGAILSGTTVIKHWWAWTKADRSSLFCSEYVARSMQNTRIFQFGNPSKVTPAGLIRRLVACEVYEKPVVIKGKKKK